MEQEFVKNYWNKASKNYMHERWEKNAVTAFDYFWTKKTLLRVLNPKPNDCILEIGCGPGTWTGVVENRVKTLVAMDISGKMVGLARKSTKKARFSVCDFLDFKTGMKFDKIFSVRVIEYVYDKKKFLRHIFHMLKPGGKVVIITKSRPCLWDLTSRSEWQRKISAMKLKSMMKNIGFEEIRYEPVSIRLPVFERGVYEAHIIPEKEEKYFLNLFGAITKCYLKFNLLPALATILSESYVISAYK